MWDIENECEIDHTKCSHYGEPACHNHCMVCTHLPALRQMHHQHHPGGKHPHVPGHVDHHHSAAPVPGKKGKGHRPHQHHDDCDLHGRACPYYTQNGVPIDINSDAWPGNPPVGAMGADGQNNIYTWDGERWMLLSDTLGLDLVITTAKLAGLDGTDAPDDTDVAMPGDGMAYNRYSLDFRAGVWLRNRLAEVDVELQAQIEVFENWLNDVWSTANENLISLLSWRYNTVVPFINATNERLYQIELFISTPIPASQIAYRDGTVADALDAIVDIVPLLPTRDEFDRLVARVDLKPDTVNRISPVLDSTGKQNITLLAGDIKFLNDTEAIPYDEDAGYSIGELVVSGGLVYVAQADIPAPAGPFNPQLWNILPTIEDEFSRVVYREAGKGLSTNDFTDTDRAVLGRAMSYTGTFTSIDAANAAINSEEMIVVTMIMSGNPDALQAYKNNTLGTFATEADLPSDAVNGQTAYVTGVGPFQFITSWEPAVVDPQWIGFFDTEADLPTTIDRAYAVAATRDVFGFFMAVGDPPLVWTPMETPELRAQSSMIIAGELGYVFDQGAWVPVADPEANITRRLVFHSGSTDVITDQDVLTQAWEDAGGSVPIPDGANLIDLDNDFFVYAFFHSSMQWFPRGADHIGIFQQGVPGMIIGSASSGVTAGRVRARDDGQGEVVGWSELNAVVNNKQDTLVAGDNITIVNNVISSTGGGGPAFDPQDIMNAIVMPPWTPDWDIPGYGVVLTYDGTVEWSGVLGLRTDPEPNFEPLRNLAFGQLEMAAYLVSRHPAAIANDLTADFVLRMGGDPLVTSRVIELHTTQEPAVRTVMFNDPELDFVTTLNAQLNGRTWAVVFSKVTSSSPAEWYGTLYQRGGVDSWDALETGTPATSIVDAFNAAYAPEYTASVWTLTSSRYLIRVDIQDPTVEPVPVIGFDSFI